MRQSHLFTKTRKEAPKDEAAKNAQLLIRGGFVHKEMAGVYDYLPLGLRVLKNIEQIIREEMHALGAEEVLLSTLQDSELWEHTNRWDDEVVDTWFKTALKNGNPLGLGFTHEEPLTRLLREHLSSYRDLPRALFQIQTKFRNELRAKSGIMRGREFLMKDLYSFVRSEEEHEAFYERAKKAYHTIFKRVGLGNETFLTFASGGVFSPYSHEFQTLTDAGEDTIYLDEEKGLAVNEEVYTDDVLQDLGLEKENLVARRAVEVGNIFSLGTRFSEPLGLLFKDEGGKNTPVVMGAYGIGLGRLMGTIVEVHSDEKGIIWPESVAPFAVHLIELDASEEKVRETCKALYKQLHTNDVAVLYDDRTVSAGEKFADSDLLGIPLRVVVSKKTVGEGKVEVKRRNESEASMHEESAVFDMLK